MARQRIRSPEVRKPDSFDDQKTPAQIANAESTAADNQEFLEYIISQIRQILGTSNWHDGVPIDLTSILGGGIAKGIHMAFGRNSQTVTGGTYLRGPGDVSSAPTASPIVLPLGATLISAAVGLDGAPGGVWELEIQANGTTIHTVTGLAASPTAIDTGLSISAAAGARIGVRVKPGSVKVTRPIISMRWTVP